MGNKDYREKNFYEKKYRENPKLCRGERYKSRNIILVNMMNLSDVKNVFEFAGATGLLAETIIKKYKNIKYYLLSDFCEEACNLARTYLRGLEGVIDIHCIDMTENLDNIPWSSFDLVTCTSLEHLPVDRDLEIIQKIKPGTKILFSLTRFGKEGHPNPYPNEEYIKKRFNKYIDIYETKWLNKPQVILMSGVKKQC